MSKKTAKSSPLYNDDKTLRICLRAGAWFMQKKGDVTGTKLIDPWSDMTGPMTKVEAHQLMVAKTPKKEAA
jgi:hypothetical protein